MTGRLCVYCKYFELEYPEEYDESFFGCLKYHWTLMRGDDPSRFRNYIARAVDCPDYEVVE